MEAEKVRPVEMASDVQRQTLLAYALKVDTGEDDHLGTEGWARHILSVRTDHAASTVEDKFAVVAGEAGGDFEIPRQIAAAHNAPRRDHETSPFKSVMP